MHLQRRVETHPVARHEDVVGHYMRCAKKFRRVAQIKIMRILPPSDLINT